MKPSLAKMLFIGSAGAFWLTPLWIYLALICLHPSMGGWPQDLSSFGHMLLSWVGFSLAVSLSLVPCLYIFNRLSDLLESLVVMLFPILFVDLIVCIFATPSLFAAVLRLNIQLALALVVFCIIGTLVYRRHELMTHRHLSAGSHRFVLNQSAAQKLSRARQLQTQQDIRRHYNWPRCRHALLCSARKLRLLILGLMGVALALLVNYLIRFVLQPSTVASIELQNVVLLGYSLSFVPLLLLAGIGVWKGHAWAIVSVWPMSLIGMAVTVGVTHQPLALRLGYLLVCAAVLLVDIRLFRRLYRWGRGAVTAR